MHGVCKKCSGKIYIGDHKLCPECLIARLEGLMEEARAIEKERGYIDEWVEAEQGQHIWIGVANLVKELRGE